MSKIYFSNSVVIAMYNIFNDDILNVLDIIYLSLYISIVAVIISLIISLPAGIFIGLFEFKFKKTIEMILFTFMGMPPVVIGLLVFLIFSSSGVLGEYGLIYTPTVMIIAQICLIIPIVTGLIMNAAKDKGKKIYETAILLGANRIQTFFILIKEMRISVLSAVIAGLGRAFSEVGAVMIVGGNIRGHTRVITTSIVMEISMGNYKTAVAFGIILLVIIFLINIMLYKLQHK